MTDDEMYDALCAYYKLHPEEGYVIGEGETGTMESVVEIGVGGPSHLQQRQSPTIPGSPFRGKLDGILNIDLAMPFDSETMPTYRIYGRSGLVASGEMAYVKSGDITNISADTPVQVTSAGHGLETGMVVTIAGANPDCLGNGVWEVAKIDNDTFSLRFLMPPEGWATKASAYAPGIGVYTGGGSWHVTGRYVTSIELTNANGFSKSETYTICLAAPYPESQYKPMGLIGTIMVE